MDYSDCLPYSCSTFTVLKNAATFPCIGDCDCKSRRHIHMFSPVLFPPLLQYSPTSWHLLRLEGLIFFPLHGLPQFITPPFFKIRHPCPCLQCLCTTAPSDITLFCLRCLCIDLINFPWNDNHKQHFKHQIYLKMKWSSEHSMTRAQGTCFYPWLSHWLAVKTSGKLLSFSVLTFSAQTRPPLNFTVSETRTVFYSRFVQWVAQ